MAIEGFTKRHLEPADRLAEVLCGLIMVLTFTLTAGLTAGSGPEAVRTLLVAAIGCNLAWGIIDGVLYVLTSISQRSSRARLAEAMKAAPDDHTALELLRATVAPKLLGVVVSDDPDSLGKVLAALRGHLKIATIRATRVTRDDVLGGFAIFLLEVFSCLPAAVPFLFIREPHLALHVSNAILIVLLFLVGEAWARFTWVPRFWTGLGMAAIGLAMVGVAALLGG